MRNAEYRKQKTNDRIKQQKPEVKKLKGDNRKMESFSEIKVSTQKTEHKLQKVESRKQA